MRAVETSRARFLLAAAVAMSITLAACGSSTSPTNPLARSRHRLSGPSLVVSIGRTSTGTMPFDIGVANEGLTDLTLVFNDGQFFDIEVSDPGGTILWRWSHDKSFILSGWYVELAPERSYHQRTDWDLTGNDGKPLAAGTYGCRVWITNDRRDEWLVYRTSITI
jgi:hypothetical protein